MKLSDKLGMRAILEANAAKRRRTWAKRRYGMTGSRDTAELCNEIRSSRMRRERMERRAAK